MPDNKGPRARKGRTLGVSGQFDWSDELFAGHPIRDPALIVVVSGLVVLLLRAGLFQAMFPAALNAPDLGDKYVVIVGWLNTLALLFLLLALLVLVVNVVRLGVDHVRYQPRVCPQCQAREAPHTAPFTHQLITGTGWEMVTCPQCGTAWEARL